MQELTNVFNSELETLEEFFDRTSTELPITTTIDAVVKDIETWKGKVSIGNKILLASFDLEVGERKFLHYCLTQVNSTKELESNKEFTITVADYSYLMDMTYDAAYIALFRAVKDISKRVIVIEGVTDEEGRSELPWFKKITKVDKLGAVTVIWNDCLIPYISNLGKLQSFTRLVNRESFTLTSKYSARLYELISMERWKGLNGSITISLNDLYNRWQIAESYQEYPVFKSKILNPAIKQLKNRDILDIELEIPRFGGKLGKKVVKITFKYSFRHSLTEYGMVSKGRYGKLEKT